MEAFASWVRIAISNLSDEPSKLSNSCEAKTKQTPPVACALFVSPTTSLQASVPKSGACKAREFLRLRKRFWEAACGRDSVGLLSLLGGERWKASDSSAT